MGVHVGTAKQAGGELEGHPGVEVEESHYWFIYPLIQALHRDHGKRIDLYGQEWFSPHELPLLRRLVDDAKALVRGQPCQWRVHIGKTSDGRELHADVHRASLVSMLDQLCRVVDTAIDRGEAVVFIGD